MPEPAPVPQGRRPASPRHGELPPPEPPNPTTPSKSLLSRTLSRTLYCRRPSHKQVPAIQSPPTLAEPAVRQGFLLEDPRDIRARELESRGRLSRAAYKIERSLSKRLGNERAKRERLEQDLYDAYHGARPAGTLAPNVEDFLKNRGLCYGKANGGEAPGAGPADPQRGPCSEGRPKAGSGQTGPHHCHRKGPRVGMDSGK